MLQDWVNFATGLSREKADFYSGARKIMRNVSATFHDLSDPLTMADSGYTRSKLSMLYTLYFHEESVKTAITLWNRRLEQRKYGSVGFTTYNHLIKMRGGEASEGKIIRGSKRASVMGPCIQSVTLTYIEKEKTTGVDAFYRTTEIYKKFPADLVFLQELLARFNFDAAPIKEVNFHFANVTVHPMYFVTIIPHLNDPIAELERIKKRDKYFFDWVVKWSARYLVPEHNRGIDKFSQALRVQKDAKERIKNQSRLIKYLNANHPGYTREYVKKEANDE